MENERSRCVGTAGLANLRAELVVARRDHAAIGVRDHHQALDAEEVPRDDERRQDVVGDTRACVADDLRVAGLEPEHRERIEPRVDAGQHCEAARRTPVGGRRGEIAGVGRVRLQDVCEGVVLGHAAIVSEFGNA